MKKNSNFASRCLQKGLSEAYVSISRIQKYLEYPELPNPEKVSSTDLDNSKIAISIEDMTCHWDHVEEIVQKDDDDENDDENDKRTMKRIKANDPDALRRMGGKCYNEGDNEGAFEYWTKAADLGDIEADNNLGYMYENGQGVEKDEEKAVYHYEMAAIGGHPIARFNLAVIEEKKGDVERAVKHLIICANLGDELSMKMLWKHHSNGNITKEDLDATLRTHQAALDAMKSEQRDAAEVVMRKYNI